MSDGNSWQVPGDGHVSPTEAHHAADTFQRVYSLSGGLPHNGASDDEDEQLRRAIALSVEDCRAPKRQKREETPEEERRQLAEAMAASLEAPSTSTPSTSDTPKQPKSQSASGLQEQTSATVLKIGGQTIDRAQMERERLERQAAREKASGKTPGPSAPAGSSRHHSMPSLHNDSQLPRAANAHPFQGNRPFPRDAAGEYYLSGEMRHTYNKVVPTQEPIFTPQDVVGAHSEISLIIASSFCIDDQWVEEANILPDPGRVPTLIIRPFPREDLNGKVQTLANSEVWSFPHMADPNWGSMHMKFFWIFYKTGRLRVCILTANMVQYDWDLVENTVFVQDFLPLSKPVNDLSESVPSHDLPLQFRSLFTSIRVPAGLQDLARIHGELPFSGKDNFRDLKKWDWSRVAFRTVISTAKKHTGVDSVVGSGMGRLGRVLELEGWKPRSGEKVVLEYQGSSLGRYSKKWIGEFYAFCIGKPLSSFSTSAAKTWPPIKVLFPSLATVDNSFGKRDGGGTMFSGNAWNTDAKELFHDANSKRSGILMHSKVIVALFEPGELTASSSKTSLGKRKAAVADDAPKHTDEGVGGWMYMGSHNFSPSAWGTLDLKANSPALNVKNYELGIVFPLPRDYAKDVATKVVPYKRPARRYGPSDVPFNQKIHQ
ncbi:hypothetical protein, variant 1 [Cryptococcus amylolentus CBS 6039]|uniref:PLD phosphodiesterase domain-containing protein n=1 Tax=Cryptococcus amylolentus CBS 6039 TaxID=1295533 RepID=A0A1E3I1E2_9TREE|nr:hypothetical protein L202_02044 [Cryptococcus amylolentus CBS 6039]XP_018995961.1 hypothetical protein, variant 1 [Cryptococcus amylolentus CBS 6039]ODN81641.1 hypothetical protein L202_02044 [Cryptococcus amylolentus CBS 6039]ODN81642.1 hypothetical protein, variant 1 [Cryptococcus amylolentus CBS 6039]